MFNCVWYYPSMRSSIMLSNGVTLRAHSNFISSIWTWKWTCRDNDLSKMKTESPERVKPPRYPDFPDSETANNPARPAGAHLIVFLKAREVWSTGGDLEEINGFTDVVHKFHTNFMYTQRNMMSHIQVKPGWPSLLSFFLPQEQCYPKFGAYYSHTGFIPIQVLYMCVYTHTHTNNIYIIYVI